MADLTDSFLADLPDLSGTAASIPRNVRAEALERDITRLMVIVDQLADALVPIVMETMAYPPQRPCSSDSYLPPQMIENAQRALEAARGRRVAEVRHA